MGKEIVYCGDCGKSLREDDFSKGKAQHLDHRPYCSDCKPLAPAPSQIQTSSKLAAMKTTTGRHTPAPSTRRRQAADDSSKTPILVGAGLVFVAAILLIVFAMSSGGRSSAPEEAPAPAPVVGPPKPAPRPAAPAPNVDKAAAAIKDLEAFVAAPSPPVAVLQRCEEIRTVVQGTAHEGRLKAIEERAREDRRVQQLDASLEEVKKLRALDPAYERKEEIVRLLNATLPLSGPRRLEVEETLRTYQRDAQAYVPAAPLPASARAAAPPAASAEALGPYDTDAAGNVNHWLVLGPFKNRNDIQGMYDADLLRTEASHVPSAGLEVATREGAKVRWTPVVVADGKLDFAQGLSSAVSAGTPTIAFGACWVVADNDLELKFKMSADLSFMMYLDGQRYRNQPKGHKIGEDEDVVRLKLTAGPHLILVKLASPSGIPYFRLKLTQNSGERMKGLRIWNQAPVARNVVFAQAFTEGLDGFSGSLADDSGAKALLVGHSAGRDRIFNGPITPQTTLRFKVKLLNDLRSFQVLMWSNKVKQNYWYHVRNLPKGEWTTVEFKLADARGGYGMNGPSALDDQPVSLGFHAEGAGPEGRALVKDLEISE
jgi:hypothetical protein